MGDEGKGHSGQASGRLVDEAVKGGCWDAGKARNNGG